MNVALRPINILSICTGGGGLDLGVELAVPGARSVCLVEREAFAVAQLVSAMEQGLMAPAPVWSDANTFDGRAWRGCVDGLIGGIPCQPHSLAGKRLADEDERDLWSTARHIIVQSGAWFVLIENVRGMLSTGGAERVWRDLRRLGFEVEPGLFAAAEVGASHERERIFLLAVSDARRAERGALALGRRVADRHAAGRDEGSGRIAEPSADVADAGGERGSSWVSGSQRPYKGRNAGKPFNNRDALVDAARFGRGEGRAEPELRGGRHPTGGAECGRPGVHRQQQMADPYCGEPATVGRDAREGAGATEGGRRAEHRAPLFGGFGCSIFPPGPADIAGWRSVLASAPELEPAFRRVADGLASRLDTARVDRLRMLGNGVVPLQAAYALRTLATRLADRGSAGADQLVRMMEAA